MRLIAVATAITVGAAVAATAAGTAATAREDDSYGQMTAIHQQLTGYQEDPLVVSTAGTAEVRIRVNQRQQEVTYTLSYSALEGAVTQAHIHFGGMAQSGGIAVFLCSNLGNGPTGTQPCPAAPGTISGTIKPTDVVGPAAQGIAPGQFDELVRAIREGTTYVNVHSATYPGGEIRAQLDDH